MPISLVKKPVFLLILVGLLIATAITSYFIFTSTNIMPPPADAAYRNANLPTTERVADLLSYMTLEEKIGQMALVEKNSLRATKDISTYGLGAVLSGFGGKPEENTLAGWRNMVDSFIDESRTSRLGIPIIYGVDAIHGHSNVPGATVFPHSIGLGASGDAALVENIARATADELLATGVRWSYSPTYDMPEDIRWGRVYETFSDDPALASKLGEAYIRGLQNDSSRSASTTNVLATAKHYIGAGGMLWNSSSNEKFKIDQGLTPVDEDKLRRHYLPPFQKAVHTGVGSVMVGLNSWGDTKLAASPYLVQTVLKDELGFKGFTVSDWYGVYEIPGSDYQAAVTAINAGIDMVMLPFDYKEFTKNVRRAVVKGEIPESRINDAVTRILTSKFKLGLFDNRSTTRPNEIGSAAHRKLAREAVAKSLVLLKDSNGVLPIRNDIRTIRVAGSAADNIGRQSGAWTVEWQGVDGNWLPGATSILQGIKESAPGGTAVEFDAEANFSTTSKKAVLGIAVVGESPYAEGWGDNSKPALSTEDLATIERLKKASDRVLVILVTGRPLFITDDIDNWDAAIVAWLPGSEGAGVADGLFGKTSFSGKLPLPWPKTVEQLPIVEGKTSDGTPPLFLRYFGLK